jgi:hypothetical protein
MLRKNVLPSHSRDLCAGVVYAESAEVVMNL